MEEELKPCPFCGEVPELPSECYGTQYEYFCDCGCSMFSIQICDLMTIEERISNPFTDHRYEQRYIDRAEKEFIKVWNQRISERN